jgi:hypothetical protein
MINIVFQGGLGNQLYQFSLALYLRTKGYTVSLDVSNYTSSDSYHEGLSIERLMNLSDFQFIRHSKTAKLRTQFKSIVPLYIKRFLLKIKILMNKLLYIYLTKELAEWDEELFRKIKINVKEYDFDRNRTYILKGYWQDEEIVDMVISELRSLISYSFSPMKQHIDLLETIRSSNSVLMHFRGGDFLSKNHRKQFDTLSSEYYDLAIDYYLNTISNPTFYIYYDDVSQMKRLLKRQINNLVILGRLSNDAVYDFVFQMQHSNFICSNSTFSWWSAKLSNHRKNALVPEFLYKSNSLSANVYNSIRAM